MSDSESRELQTVREAKMACIYLVVMLCLLVLLYRHSAVARYYLKFTYFGLHAAFTSTIFIPIMLLKPGDWRNALFPAWALRQLEKPYGLRWEVTGQENMIEGSGSVILLNHQSFIDLIALAEIWPVMGRCTVISKNAIFYYWPFGLAAYLWGTIFIDRVNPDKAKETINKTAEIIHQRKARLCMFPEGTRSDGKELLPFKKGAFHVAVGSNLPIQPVVVSRYYFIDSKRKHFNPGHVRVQILPAISTEGYTKDNLQELIDKTYTIMAENYKQLNAAVDQIRDVNDNQGKSE